MSARKPTAPDATLAALYKAVLAAPDDDLPRLVYADRLEELGDQARAEFIRLQIHVASTKPWDEGHSDALVRSRVLYDRHEEAWGITDLTRELVRSKGTGPLVFRPFVRGFPEETWANIESFSAAHRKALKKYPIRELVLVGGHTAAVSRVSEFINEVGPRIVDLSSTWRGVFATLTDGPPLPTVRKLVLNCDLYSPTAKEVRALAGSFNFPNVEAVSLSGSVDEVRMLAFVENLRWPKVRDVYLHGLFDAGVLHAMGTAKWADRLERLSVYHDAPHFRLEGGSGDRPEANMPVADLVPLFRSQRLTNLRSLSLDSFPFPPAVERAFAKSTLGPLDHFEIDGWCDPPVSNDHALLSAPPLASVKSLDLPGSVWSSAVVEQLGRNPDLRHLKWDTFEIDPETWAALAASPLTQTLRRLHLERADLTADAVKALLAWRPWPHLAEWVLKYGKCDGRAVAELIDHPHFARLTHLDLPGGPHAAHLWKVLAKSKTVGRFHKLRLGFAVTDVQLNALLDNPEVCKIGQLVLPTRVKVDRKTQRRYEKVFGVRITWDW